MASRASLDGYQQQVGPGGTPALPGISPGNYSAIGEAVAQFGEHEIERDRQKEATDAAVKIAQAQADHDVAVAGAQQNAGPGGAGVADAVKTDWDARQQAIIDGIRNPEVRRNVQAQLAEIGAASHAKAQIWTMGQSAAKVVTDLKTATDTQASRLQSIDDPEQLRIAMEGNDRTVADLNLPADKKDELRLEADGLLVKSYATGQATRNPQALIAALDGGKWDQYLDPAAKEALHNSATVEIRRREHLEKAKADADKAARARDRALLSARLDAGEDVPDADLISGANSAAADGDKVGAYKLDVARMRNGVNRETLPWKPGDFDTAINGLRGLGEKRTPAQDVRLKQLETIAPKRIAEFNANPDGYMAGIGRPRPDLNLSDPASIAANAAWRQVASATTGRPVQPLPRALEADMAATVAASPKGQLEVANQLAALGGADAQAAARQVSPHDATLERMVMLRPADRAAFQVGREARKAFPGLVDGTAGADAREDFNAAMGGAARLFSPDQVAALFEATRNIYAASASHHGVQAYDADGFRAQIPRSLGGGAIGTWHGQKVLLLPGMSPTGFEASLSAYSVDPHRETAPAFADGTVMTADQLRRGFTPVLRPDGRYEFHDAHDRVAMTRSRKVFVIEFPKLAR